MEEEILDAVQETEEVAPSTTEGEEVSEDVKTPQAEPKPAEKTVPYSRFKEVNDRLSAIKKQQEKSQAGLDVEDYIDISASLDGLDQREKERLAYEHKTTGKSLKDLRASEDFQLWQSAYQAKKEKESLSLKPSTTQSESERPKTLTEKLRTASLAEKESILAEAGLYKSPRPRLDRVEIGKGR